MISSRCKPVCLIALFLLSACKSIVSFEALDASTFSVEQGTTCHSGLGSYHLPRRLIEVKIMREPSTPQVFGINVQEGAFIADNREVYCLDFLPSKLAVEKIGVERDGTLLSRIYTKSIDNSATIAKDAIQAAADLVANSRVPSTAFPGSARASTFNGEGLSATVIRKFEYDPTDEQQARDVNAALAPFGYCLYLDRRRDEFVPNWSATLCEGALITKGRTYAKDGRSGLNLLAKGPVSKLHQRRGVLYRPMLTHSLVIMKQDHPGIPSAQWFRSASTRVQMPNSAPAFLLEVKRAAFVTAETDIKFKKGMLQNIAIDRPSGFKILSDVAVSTAQVIVNIPAQTFKIFNNRAANIERLISVNERLIDTLEGLEAAKRDAATPNPESRRFQSVQGDNRLILQQRSTTGTQTLTDQTNVGAEAFARCVGDIKPGESADERDIRCERDLVDYL